MGFGKLLGYTIGAGLTGMVVAGIAQGIGYDISIGEGFRHALLVSIPGAAIFSYDNEDYEYPDWIEDSPYLAAFGGAVVFSGALVLGSLLIETLTRTPISQVFAAAVGGLEGAVVGMLESYSAREGL